MHGGCGRRLLPRVSTSTISTGRPRRRYLTGHDEEGFARWVRAHQVCLADGAVHRAAIFGGKLAQGFGFKGDWGRCRGWVDRCARLLDEANIDCVEQGYLQ